MQLAEDVEVMRFEDAEPGDLLIGRVSSNRPNFVAIRAKRHEKMKDDSAAVVALNGLKEDAVVPIYTGLAPGKTILNLRRDWFLDVLVGDQQPTFSFGDGTLLVRVGATYFLRLQDNVFLNIATGGLEVEPPFYEVPFAAWSSFRVRLGSPKADETGEVLITWGQI